MFNLLKKKIKLKIPLSQILYQSSGIVFQWNNIRLTLPYDRFPLTVSNGPLFEEFKGDFQGIAAIYLECHRVSFTIEIVDIKVDKNVEQKFTEITSRIRDAAEQIKSWAARDSITFDLVRTLLHHNGFQYDDSKIHNILAEIIDSLPPQQILEKVPFAPSVLNYHSKGIQFHYKNVRYEVEKNKLPLEVGPALEKLKSGFNGHITFHIEILYLQKWDRGREQLRMGQVKQEVKQVEVNPYILQGFKVMRSQLISDSIKELVENASTTPIFLDTIESLLENWGLDLSHHETARHIVSTIPPWTEEKDVKVPLKDITYRDSDIVAPIAGENMKIPGKHLPIKTNHEVEDFKHIFEGHINIHIFRPFQFIWDAESRQLAFDKKKSVKIKINIDEETLEQYKRICWIYIEMGAEVIPSGTVVNQQQGGDDAAAAAAAANVEGLFPEQSQKELILDLPIPVDKVPPAEITGRGHDAESIRILEEMADKIFTTTKDLWFGIADRLIWERPGTATYIFKWPDEELEFFIAKIWASELQDIRDDKESSGYIGRVPHKVNDTARWEKKLKRILKIASGGPAGGQTFEKV